MLVNLGDHGKSAVALNLVLIAERNLANLALQAVHETRRASSEADREQIAIAGMAIARARQIVLPLVLEAK
jgi:hypothetical protein